MRDALGPGTMLGYCTNVHPGADYAQMLVQLERHAIAVKDRVSPAAPMGVGLWLSASVAKQLREEPDGVPRFRDWLDDRGLTPFTFNGFPFGDFHREVVKHHVYRPSWDNLARLDYTRDLAAILFGLLKGRGDGNDSGSISTLPIGWRGDDVDLDVAAQMLARLSDELWQYTDHLGYLIHVDLEPEPGCMIDRPTHLGPMLDQVERHAKHKSAVRQQLRVCHDVCHAAVMFDDQAAALEAYREAGIRLGKVQVSSAVRAPFVGGGEGDQRDERDIGAGDGSASDGVAILDCLRRFHEPRYLHQTVIDGDRFYDDLSDALAEAGEHPETIGDEWRVHFHVPIYLDAFGPLRTARDDILAFFKALDLTGYRKRHELAHFEVETYAWDVLPDELKHAELADGIAQEMRWLIDVAAQLRAETEGEAS